MRTQKFYLSLLCFFATALGLLTACHGDKPRVITEQNPDFILPVEGFGKSQEEVKQMEKRRNIIATAKGDDLLEVVYKNQNTSTVIHYYFEDDKYLFAEETLDASTPIKDFVAKLTDATIGGFEEDPKASAEPTERLFVHPKKHILLSLSTESKEGRVGHTLSFGPQDESLFSWTRTQDLREGLLRFPLLAEEAPLSLVRRYEARLGNHYDPKESVPERGIYNYLPKDGSIKGIRYRMDPETKNELEECAIRFKPEAIPDAKQVETWLTRQGFEKTNLSMEIYHAVLYYHRQKKVVASVELNKPKDPTKETEYAIHFFFKELKDVLPKEHIDFPMPILKFREMSVEQAIEMYKKEPYYKSDKRGKVFGQEIETTSEDFDKMIIAGEGDEFENKYSIVMVFAKNRGSIASPELIKILEKNGFVKKPELPVHTYINPATNVVANIDMNNETGQGYYIAFFPLDM